MVCELNNCLPIPFLSTDIMTGVFSDSSVFNLLGAVSNNAFSETALLYLSVSPCVGTRVVVRLLAFTVPCLREGTGRNRTNET